MDTTYDVRVYKTEVYRGARVSSYRVRWKTGGQDWRRSFRNAGQADVFRAELLAAARKGEAFNVATGEPVAWQRDEPGMSWYDFEVEGRVGEVPACHRAGSRLRHRCDGRHGRQAGWPGFAQCAGELGL